MVTIKVVKINIIVKIVKGWQDSKSWYRNHDFKFYFLYKSCYYNDLGVWLWILNFIREWDEKKKKKKNTK